MGKLRPSVNDIFCGLRKFSAHHNDFITQSTLSNGMTLTTQPRLLDGNIAFTVHINSGSFEDPEGKEGVAHFLEHILMDYSHWNQAFQRRKGHFGLWTGAEGIKLAGEIPAGPENEELLLGAIEHFLKGKGIQNSAFVREKRRILNEIGIDNDDAARNSANMLGHAFDLGRANSNILGTREGIRNTQLEDLKAYHDTWFRGPNIFVGITGRVRHDHIKNLLEKSLSDIPSEKTPSLTQVTLVPGYYNTHADLQQLYFNACFPIPALDERQKAIHAMAVAYLSEKITSDVIFKSGIVYAARSSSYFSPARKGHLDISANIMPEEAEHIIPELTGVVTAAIDGIDKDVFGIVKDNFRHIFEKERTLYAVHTADDLATFPTVRSRITPHATITAAFEAVEADDVHRYLVDQVFSSDPAIVTLGDDSRLGSYEDFVEPIRQTLAKMNLPCPK